MDLWARIAPAAWLDLKRWRGSASAHWLDAAVALAADADNVAEAELDVARLRAALAPYGVRLGSRVRWRFVEGDSAIAAALLAGPLSAASDACPAAERSVLCERAERAGRAVHAAALARFGERPGLAADLAHAARVDELWRASRLSDAANPVTPLRALWARGYLLGELDAAGVTLEMPPLSGVDSVAV
jgi:hypothetical protein